jgi:hypothetical protein
LIAECFWLIVSAAGADAFDETALAWDPSEVDWEEVFNDVLAQHIGLAAGTQPAPIPFERGSPQWCMKRAMELDPELVGV